MAKQQRPSVPAVLFSVEEACEYLRLSRASLFRLLALGQLPKVRIGGRTLIRRTDIDAMVERSVERRAAPAGGVLS